MCGVQHFAQYVGLTSAIGADRGKGCRGEPSPFPSPLFLFFPLPLSPFSLLLSTYLIFPLFHNTSFLPLLSRSFFFSPFPFSIFPFYFSLFPPSSVYLPLLSTFISLFPSSSVYLCFPFSFLLPLLFFPFSSLSSPFPI